MKEKCYICHKEIGGKYKIAIRIYYPNQMLGKLFCSWKCAKKYIDKMI